jgi:hypothetical protein
MPKFKIVVEVGSTRLLSKEFEADKMEHAQSLAMNEDCEGEGAEGWEEIGSNSVDEIREDQCEEIK